MIIKYQKLKTPKTIFNLWYFILMVILLYYWTVNVNQKRYDFWTVKWLMIYFNYICILVLTTLKVATWLAETCCWVSCNKITSRKPKCICWTLTIYCLHMINAWNTQHTKLQLCSAEWANDFYWRMTQEACGWNSDLLLPVVPSK
jgi:hypothetical protein